MRVLKFQSIEEYYVYQNHDESQTYSLVQKKFGISNQSKASKEYYSKFMSS